ncbi:arginase [Zychaea mexicana]|uniref:arginase n=1 Tax=Zychaea mexicana TaxID=64656 RepID=UPI0022FE1AE2|nr:arginase [Zychaea mexicana]KAI9490086.1 arginase [Zychaea mexicana]
MQQSFGDHDIRPNRQAVHNVQTSSTPSVGDPGAPEGDGGKTADAVFAGIPTFAHLPYEQCWSNDTAEFDIAFIGAPFDTGTSYRPGARFGPAGIRDGSRRLALYGGYNVPMDVNPFQAGARVVDCSDIFVSSYDNELAIKQIQDGHQAVLHHAPATPSFTKFPRVITLGGDHTITLPLLRSINSAYGPVSVIHFDSHLDTWKPKVFGGSKSAVAAVNHGTYFYHASQEGLLKKGESIHAGIRTTLSGPSDYENDLEMGFEIVEARDIDTIGTQGIIERIRERVGDNLVYLSIDIDVLDPAFAPATGTPETGGWSTRELRRIVRGLEGLKFVGADIVEVSTPYDTNAQVTALAAADLMLEVMSLMVKTPIT